MKGAGFKQEQKKIVSCHVVVRGKGQPGCSSVLCMQCTEYCVRDQYTNYPVIAMYIVVT